METFVSEVTHVGDDSDGGEDVGRGVEHVLGTHEPAVEEREAGDRHQQHQSGAREHPGGISRVERGGERLDPLGSVCGGELVLRRIDHIAGDQRNLEQLSRGRGRRDAQTCAATAVMVDVATRGNGARTCEPRRISSSRVPLASSKNRRGKIVPFQPGTDIGYRIAHTRRYSQSALASVRLASAVEPHAVQVSLHGPVPASDVTQRVAHDRLGRAV